MGSSEYLLWLLKIMSFAPVRKELQITKRQRTSLTALSKKYIYIPLLLPVGKKSRFRAQPNRSCPLQQLSFLDWFPFAKPVVFFI